MAKKYRVSDDKHFWYVWASSSEEAIALAGKEHDFIGAPIVDTVIAQYPIKAT